MTLDQFLQVYLPQAIYANPPILAKELKLSLSFMHAGLERLVARHEAVLFPLARNGSGYLWCGPVATTTKKEII